MSDNERHAIEEAGRCIHAAACACAKRDQQGGCSKFYGQHVLNCVCACFCWNEPCDEKCEGSKK